MEKKPVKRIHSNKRKEIRCSISNIFDFYLQHNIKDEIVIYIKNRLLGIDSSTRNFDITNIINESFESYAYRMITGYIANTIRDINDDLDLGIVHFV